MKIELTEAEFKTLREALAADTAPAGLRVGNSRESIAYLSDKGASPIGRTQVEAAAWLIVRARGRAADQVGSFVPQAHFNQEMGRIVLTTEPGEQP